MEADKINVKTFCIAVAAVVLVEACARAASIMAAVHPLTATGVARCIEIGLLAAIVIQFGNGMSSIGLGRREIIPGIAKGLVWSFGFGIVVVFLGLILAGFDSDPLRLIATRLPGARETRIVFVLVGALIAPVAEEIFFRGILYGFFRRWGAAAAITLSTLLFTLAHPPGAGIPFTQMTGGILFAAAYEAEGKLMAPIILHVLGNAAIFTVSMVMSGLPS